MASVSSRQQSSGAFRPTVETAHGHAPRVAVSSIPTAAGAAIMGGSAAAYAAWCATRPTLAQRLAWSFGGMVVAGFAWLEGHGDLAAASAGVLSAGAAVGTLEATGIATRT